MALFGNSRYSCLGLGVEMSELEYDFDVFFPVYSQVLYDDVFLF